MKNISFLFVLAFVLFGLGPEASAHQKYSSKTKGNQASFSSWSYDECSYSGVSVWAFEQQERGNKTSYGAVYVDYYSYNYCTGHNAYGWGYFDSSNFSQQKLNSASLTANGTMELYSCDYDMGGGGDGDGDGDGGGSAGAGPAPGGDYVDPCTYTSAPIQLSINWSGTGDTYKDRSTNSYNSPYARYRSRYTGQYRDASVSGLFTIGGEAVSLADGWGSLAQTTSGTFEMYR